MQTFETYCVNPPQTLTGYYQHLSWPIMTDTQALGVREYIKWHFVIRIQKEMLQKNNVIRLLNIL